LKHVVQGFVLICEGQALKAIPDGLEVFEYGRSASYMLQDLFAVKYEFATRLQLVNPRSYSQSVRCVGLMSVICPIPMKDSHIKVERGSGFYNFFVAIGWKGMKAKAFLESTRNAICQQRNVTQNQHSHGLAGIIHPGHANVALLTALAHAGYDGRERTANMDIEMTPDQFRDELALVLARFAPFFCHIPL
jgi:hypothetical protein